MRKLISIVAVLLALTSAAFAQQAPTVVDAPAAGQDLLRAEVWKKSFRAGAHTRWHAKMADHYAKVDWWLRWTTIALGAAALAGPLVMKVPAGKLRTRLERGWLAVAVVTFVVSIYATFNDAPRLHNEHAVLEKRWNALAHEWKQLMIDRDELSRDQLHDRFDHLAADERAIESAEPPGEPGPSWLQAWHEESRAQGLKIPPVPPTRSQS